MYEYDEFVSDDKERVKRYNLNLERDVGDECECAYCRTKFVKKYKRQLFCPRILLPNGKYKSMCKEHYRNLVPKNTNKVKSRNLE